MADTLPDADDRESHDVDVCVIGLGSGGEHLAKLLANAGMSVIGFEPGLVGGECPFLACIPSKSLLHDAASGKRAWAQAVERRDELTNHRNDDEHADGLTDAGVTLIRERAELAGERSVMSDNHRVTATHVVIATGAEPVRPHIPGVNRDSVWTSADALSSGELPSRLVVIGGGPIGSELSQVYARFGADVTLCEQSEVLTDDAEPELSELLADRLRADGIDLRLSVEVSAIAAGDGDQTGDGGDGGDHDGDVVVVDGEAIPADRVLLATGVEPRLSGIGLDSIDKDAQSVQIGADGRIDDLDWLWAVGDVTPQSHWTHSASIQARSLADRIQGEAWPDETPVMPRCIFTDPPLGVVGMTAAMASSQGHDVIVGSAEFADVSRAATDGIEHGKAAIVVDRPSRQILGASIVGLRADDLIQIVTALMATETTITAARRLVFPFPTLSQVVEQAIADAVERLETHQ